MPSCEAMLMMRPPPRSTMWGVAQRAARNTALRSTARTLSNVASVICSSGVSSRTPAEFTRMSIPPSSSTIWFIAARTASPSVTSTASAVARPPELVHCSATAVAFGSLRSSTATSAPSSAKRTAMAAPIPPPPPMTTATLPVSCSSMSSSLGSLLCSAGPADGQAAVDDELLPRDVGRVVAGQEADGAGGLVDVAQATPRDDGTGGVEALPAQRVDPVQGLLALDQPGDDGVHPDLPWCELQGQGPAQAEQAGLRRRVVVMFFPPVDATGDRGGRDHRPALGHPRAAGAEDAQDPGEVDGHHVVPRLVGHLRQRRPARAAGRDSAPPAGPLTPAAGAGRRTPPAATEISTRSSSWSAGRGSRSVSSN